MDDDTNTDHENHPEPADTKVSPAQNDSPTPMDSSRPTPHASMAVTDHGAAVEHVTMDGMAVTDHGAPAEHVIMEDAVDAASVGATASPIENVIMEDAVDAASVGATASPSPTPTSPTVSIAKMETEPAQDLSRALSGAAFANELKEHATHFDWATSHGPFIDQSLDRSRVGRIDERLRWESLNPGVELPERLRRGSPRQHPRDFHDPTRLEIWAGHITNKLEYDFYAHHPFFDAPDLSGSAKSPLLANAAAHSLRIDLSTWLVTILPRLDNTDIDHPRAHATMTERVRELWEEHISDAFDRCNLYRFNEAQDTADEDDAEASRLEHLADTGTAVCEAITYHLLNSAGFLTHQTCYLPQRPEATLNSSGIMGIPDAVNDTAQHMPLLNNARITPS